MTLLTVAGIGLGASLVFASLAVGRGAERSIESTVEASLGRSDFRVTGFDGGMLSDEMLVAIRSVHGVEVAAPSVDLPGTLLPEPDSAAPNGSPVTIHGIDPVLDAQVRDLDLAAGETITRPDEAAAIITERLAAEEGYGLGSDVIVATPGAPELFRVIGIAAGDGPFLESGGRTVILPIDAVKRLFGIEGVARVDLLVAEDVPVDGVRAELGEALAGQSYVLTSPADLTESLRRPTAGFSVTVTGLAVLGALVGAVLVFGAIRLTGPDGGEIPSGSRVRGIVVPAAVGSVVGASLALVAGALAMADVGPPALGITGTAGAVVVVLLSAVGARVLPLERVSRTPAPMLAALARGLGSFVESGVPRSLREDTRIARTVLGLDGAGSARTVVLVGSALGLIVAVAMIGANAHLAAAGQAPAPVVARVAAQVDALGLLAVFVAGMAIVGIVALGHREHFAQGELRAAGKPYSRHVGRVMILEAGILGLAGAVLGSTAGLAVGAVLILLGGGHLNPAAEVPWAALGLCLVLGVGLSLAAAWYPARLAGRRSVVRAVQFG
jgi:ABC-type lipoprotein release transport system permease subunit